MQTIDSSIMLKIKSMGGGCDQNSVADITAYECLLIWSKSSAAKSSGMHPHSYRVQLEGVGVY